jgi:hypothetical protein
MRLDTKPLFAKTNLNAFFVCPRAWNGPGAQVVRPLANDANSCEFIWLMDCEYKGWIPSSILELAMPIAQLQFVDCVRKLALKL